MGKATKADSLGAALGYPQPTSINTAAIKAPDATARLTVHGSLVATIRRTNVPTPKFAKSTAASSACRDVSAPNLPGSLMGTP